MKKDLGNTDRLLRLIFAAGFATLFFSKLITGIPGYILLGLAIILFVTSVAGYCLLYRLLGINSRKNSSGTGNDDVI